MVAHGLTAQWNSDQFLPSQFLQAIGQSFALSGIVFFGVLHLRPQDALTFGAALQTARLMGGEIGTAFVTTVVRVRSQVASNLIGLHVRTGDGDVVQRLQAYAAVAGRRDTGLGPALGPRPARRKSSNRRLASGRDRCLRGRWRTHRLRSADRCGDLARAPGTCVLPAAVWPRRPAASDLRRPCFFWSAWRSAARSAPPIARRRRLRAPYASSPGPAGRRDRRRAARRLVAALRRPTPGRLSAGSLRGQHGPAGRPGEPLGRPGGARGGALERHPQTTG